MLTKLIKISLVGMFITYSKAKTLFTHHSTSEIEQITKWVFEDQHFAKNAKKIMDDLGSSNTVYELTTSFQFN